MSAIPARCYTGCFEPYSFSSVEYFFEAVTTATGMQLDDRRATPIRRTEVARRSNLSRVATAVTAAFTLLVRRTRTRFADSSFAEKGGIADFYSDRCPVHHVAKFEECRLNDARKVCSFSGTN